MQRKKTARHKARRYALQACYQWQISETPLEEIIARFANNVKNDHLDYNYFICLVNGTMSNRSKIDDNIALFSSCELEQLTPIELSILRIAVYELIDRKDVPYRVVINEALELGKTFGSTDNSFQYINGVLDKMATTLRQEETQQKNEFKRVNNG